MISIIFVLFLKSEQFILKQLVRFFLLSGDTADLSYQLGSQRLFSPSTYFQNIREYKSTLSYLFELPESRSLSACHQHV